MAYKKYIQRNGKLYGPYIYHSKRVGGKVVSEYYGNRISNYNYKKILFIFFGVLLLAALIYFIAFSNKGISGKTVLESDISYEAGKPLAGVLKFSLMEGELLPESSKIVFENAGKTQEFVLGDIFDESSSEGEYYVYGKEIQGEGLGYGIEGKKEIYPEVEFTLQIYTESKDKEEKVEEIPEQVNDTSLETVPEIVSEETTPEVVNVETVPEAVSEEIAPETSSPEAPSESSTEENSGLTVTGNSVNSRGFFASLFSPTGMVSMELQNEIEGTASKNNPFVYGLKEGETAELVPKSVKIGGEKAEDNIVSLKIENNQVIVTTDYSYIEKGYGEDYSGDKEKTVSLDLVGLNLYLEEGDLTIKLIYEEEEIVRLLTTLKEGETISNETVVDINESEEGNNSIEDELNESINEFNESIIETNQTINDSINFSIKDIEDFLTSEERTILTNKFGNITLKKTKSELFNNRIIIGYNFSEYYIEYSYDSSLSKEVLDLQMENDRIKFLKDIASSISKKESLSKKIEGFNESYDF